MATAPKTIRVTAETTLPELLDDAAREPIILERDGERFRLSRDEDSAYEPDPDQRHIAIVDGAGGPKAIIAGHRVRVEDIVVWHEKLGMSPDEIVDAIPTITLADVHAALAYYWDNREDLDRQMEKNSATADEYRRLIDDGRLAQKLLRRLG